MAESGGLMEARTSQAENQKAQCRVRAERRSLKGGKPPEAYLAAYLCTRQWLRGGWPPQDDWPKEDIWRAAGAMFVEKLNQGLTETLWHHQRQRCHDKLRNSIFYCTISEYHHKTKNFVPFCDTSFCYSMSHHATSYFR